MEKNDSQFPQIVLGGGCFWCLEAMYQRVNGVVEVVPGYAGGHLDQPTYERVCEGNTGHAEVVRVKYDPAVLNLDGVFEWFWACHDPTQINRQGNDVGPQYRSIILYSDETQKKAAEASRAAYAEQLVAKGVMQAIATEIVALTHFWEAEAYHHNYFNTHPWNSYCSVVIRPKLHKIGVA